jgi:hypothetical protein
LPTSLFAQQREAKDWALALQSDYIHFDRIGARYTAGVTAEYMLHKYFGIQMTAAGSHNTAYFSGPLVLIPLGIVIAEKGKGSGRDAVSLMEILFWLSAFESPTFHLPFAKHFEFVFYLSFFRARYIWDTELRGENGWYASRSTGFKLNYFLGKKGLMSIHTESSQLYYSGRPKGFQAGVSIGLLLNN